MFGYLPRYDFVPIEIDGHMRTSAIQLRLSENPLGEARILATNDKSYNSPLHLHEAFNFTVRLAALHELREAYRTARHKDQLKMVSRQLPRWKAPVAGDWSS